MTVFSSRSYVIGVGLVALAALGWSSGGLLSRMIQDATPWHVMAYRALFSLPILFGAFLWRHGTQAPRVFRLAGLEGILGGIGLSMAFIGYILAIMNTTVANALFILSAGPIFTAILNRFFLGEPISPATTAAILCAVGGVGIMVLDGIGAGGLFGNLMALCSTLGFSLFTICLRRRLVKSPGADMAAAVILGALITLGIGFLFAGGFSISRDDLLICLVLGVAQIGAPALIYNAGARRLPAAQAVLIAQLEILLGTLWVWWLLAEQPSLTVLGGGAVVLCAVVGQTVWNARAERLSAATKTA